MWKDPIVNEVRRIREELAEQHNFDVGSIFAEIRKKQTTYGKRLICRESQMKAEQGAAPDRYSATLKNGR